VFIAPKRTYAGYIFDCDGTLADSMPLHHQAWISAFRAHDASIDFSWELFMRRAGMTLERTVEELNLELGLTLDPPRVAAEQRRVYQLLMRDIRPIEPVVAFARDAARRHPVTPAPARVSSGLPVRRAARRRTPGSA